MAGLFITVEGADGAGKTTLISLLVPKLKEKLDCQIIVTREPGGNVIAEKIRQLILDKEHRQMDPRTEALLYAASRRQHLVHTVLPALKANAIVICDRFVDSSLAYQGYAREIGVEGIQAINTFATDNVSPDLTFYIRVDAKEGLKRIKENRQQEVNRLDLEGEQFHEKVVLGYEKIVQQESSRFIVLDGMQSREKLVEEALQAIETKFPKLFER